MENTTDPFDDNMTSEPISCPFGWNCIEADDEEEIIDNLVHWLADGMPDDVPSKD
jgi:hypothetical protein